MFHGIYRVAEALIALQKIGNISYMSWAMEVNCKPQNVLALVAQARLMEDELQKWKNEVKLIRADYYELNYFTNLQLTKLRKDLGILKTHANISSVSPAVVALLQSVSMNITREAVVSVVRKVATSPLCSTSKSVTITSHSHNEARCQYPYKAETSNTRIPQENAVDSTCTNRSRLLANKLSNEQNEIFMYNLHRFGFPQLLILKAFEECKGKVNKYDVQQWCTENADKYQFHDDKSDDETSDIENEEPPVSQPTALSWIDQSSVQLASQKHSSQQSKTEVEGNSPPRLDSLFIIVRPSLFIFHFIGTFCTGKLQFLS